MIRTLLKLLAYSRAPKATFSFLHPVTAVQLVKTPFDLKTAYAPRITALAAVVVVAPLAYRLGRRSGEGTLLTPRGSRRSAAAPGTPLGLSGTFRPLD